jgi:hypothetical protein
MKVPSLESGVHSLESGVHSLESGVHSLESGVSQIQNPHSLPAQSVDSGLWTVDCTGLSTVDSRLDPVNQKSVPQLRFKPC